MAERNPLPNTCSILFADNIIVEAGTGKKSLIGLYATICSTELPLQREINIYVELSDLQGQYHFTLELVHLETNTVIANGSMGPINATERLRPMEIIIRLPARLPKHGKYEFRMLYGQAVFASRVFQFNPISDSKEGASESDMDT